MSAYADATTWSRGVAAVTGAAAFLVVLAGPSSTEAAPTTPTPSARAAGPATSTWHASWATAQHVAGPTLSDQTVRTVVHLTQGGPRLRISLAQQATSAPIRIDQIAVGRRSGTSDMAPGSVRDVTFGGHRAVTIKPGQRVTSDPVRLRVGSETDIMVDTYVRDAAVPSAHQLAFDTSYLTPAGGGNHTGETSGADFTQTTDSYLLVSSVDVAAKDIAGTVVVVGGSVVDGLGSRSTGTLGTGPEAPPNSRWSDVLARRLRESQPAHRQISVANVGISANTASPKCAIVDGRAGNVTQRYGRDVLSRAGLTHVFVYAGTNDLAAGCSAGQIITAFKGLANRAHRRGVDIIFATITPRASYTAEQNERRSVVNRWLLRGGHCAGYCDGVANFDDAIADPTDPHRIDPTLDSGDGIHPNAEGYARMAQIVPLRFFRHPNL